MNTLQCFSQAPVSPAVPLFTPIHLHATATSLCVNSATSDDLRKMQRTLETLSERVEQLQLEVQRQRQDKQHGSSDYRSRQRSPTPDSGRGHKHYYSSHRNTYRDSSYDRYSAHDNSYRPSRHERDRYDRRDSHARSGSSLCTRLQPITKRPHDAWTFS